MKKTVGAEGNGMRLILGDCLEVMKSIPPTSVHAVITDPPYGIKYNPQSKKHGSFTPHEKIIGDDSPFDPAPMLRFTKFIIWGANCFASRLPDSPVWLAWDKATRNGLKLRIAEMELAWTWGISRPQMFRHLWSGAYRASEAGTHYHPTQKPVALMAWCIKLLTKPGDVVLDPYMGSGTTGVACVQTGRDFIGIEIDPGYFKIAERRIKEARAQIALPMGEATTGPSRTTSPFLLVRSDPWGERGKKNGARAEAPAP